MKKLLILLLMLAGMTVIIPNSTMAQSIVKFPDSNAYRHETSQWAPDGSVWTYTQTFVFSSRIDTLVIRTVGDTVIQDKECKILQRSAGTCDLRPWKEYMYSDSGKVFFYDGLRDEFQKLYDFNAEEGQSWSIYLTLNGSYASPDTITVTIDSVRSILINDVLLKKQFVSYTSSNFFWVVSSQGVIIEGFGYTWSMFPWYYGGCDANWAGPLRCYYDNLLGLVDFETAPTCDYVSLGIEDSGSTGFLKVYPNPANKSVVFEVAIGTLPIMSLPENPQTISITNIYGREIDQIPLTGDKTVWDTREVAMGVYFYRIENSNTFVSGKLIILK